MITEDTYEAEMGRMVTVRVKVSDYVLEEERHSALPGQPQQPQDDITLLEDGAVCVIANNRKTPVKVPKAVARAAARVGGVARDHAPNRSTVRVRVTPR